MTLVSMQDLTLSFGGVPLVEAAHAQVEEGDRVVLLGRNGCGKSTLLRCLAGLQEPDRGLLRWARGIHRGFLPQEVPRDLFGPVQDLVLGAVAARVAAAEAASEHGEAWALRQGALRLVAELELKGDRLFEQLSGGQQRRALLARALAGEPELLLLDEPTNHLDLETIGRLEARLLAYPGTLVLVTHDRALARRLATRVLDLDRGRLTSWDCDHATYLRRKEDALAAEEAALERLDRTLDREETWIRQGIKARRTRNEGRVRALERLRVERAQRREALGPARLRIQDGGRSGDMVLEVRDLAFRWPDGPRVAEGLSTRIVRGDRIGILGPNGSGKTTLLRLLLGELPPDRGAVRRGARLEVVYSDQLRESLDGTSTVLDAVAGGDDTVLFEGRPTHVAAYLSGFLFDRDRLGQPVSALSGGERNRLGLARLFTRPCNVLVLDEPTNDLDMETLEILERLLVDFPGTLLLVSHDREFLDNVVTSTMVLEGDGRVVEYAGGYTDWLSQRPASIPEARPPEAPRAPRPDRPRKLTFNEARELDALEPRIAALEEERGTLLARLADPALYRDAGAEVAGLRRRLPLLEAELEQACARWEELETLREEGRRRG